MDSENQSDSSPSTGSLSQPSRENHEASSAASVRLHERRLADRRHGRNLPASVLTPPTPTPPRPSNFAFLYAQRMIRRSLDRGDRIIAVSQNTGRPDAALRRRRPQDRGGLQRRRGRLPRAPGARGLAALAARLGISRPYLLFVGNPAKPHKNLDTVVQAYARARRMAQFDAPLICVGGAARASEFKIRQRAEYLGIGDKVRLLGHVAHEALPAIYQGATLFLYPTLYEGFGLPVIEAMASGVAVITSNTSALKEIGEGYAPLVDPLDLDGMAKAIAHLMGSPERRAAFAERGVRPRRGLPLGPDGAADAGHLPFRHRRKAERRHRDAAPGSPPTAAPGPSAIPVPAPPQPRVALVHDWLTGMRGGEKVIEVLGGALPGSAALHPLPLPRQRQPGDRVAPDPHQLPAARPPASAATTGSYLPLFPAAIEELDLSGFDLVVSSSHCVAKGVIAPPDAFHLCYCHTPMRYAWDQEHAYFPDRTGLKARLRSLALSALRAWDVSSAARVHHFVANSRFVARRIQTYYGRPAEVVHPPVERGLLHPGRRRAETSASGGTTA